MSSNALLWPSQGTNPEERLDKYKYLRIPSQGVSDGDGIPPIILPSDVMAYDDTNVFAYEVDWFNILWQKRIQLTINDGNVPTTQTNFPLLINNIFTDLIGAVPKELRFTGEDNIQLEYEIQKFVTGTGELIAWINKPTVSDSDIINIYYDNPGVEDAENKNAVWDANYNAVYHMNGIGDDSTSNNQDMTLNNVNTVPAQIGDGLEFLEDVTSFTIRNPFTGFPSTAITCEFWISSPPPTSVGDGMVSYAINLIQNNHFLTLNQINLSVTIHDQTSGNSGIGLNDGNFHHVVITWRSSDGQLFVYADGVEEFDFVLEIGESHEDGGSLVLGQDQDDVGGGFSPSQALNGILDEVRLSNIFRSADYVLTSFNNQSDPSAFYSTGTSENVPSVDRMLYD